MPDTPSTHSGADDYLANIVEGRCADAESILRMVVMARAEIRRLEEQLTTVTRDRDEMAQLHEDHSRALRMEKDWEKARIVQLEEQLQSLQRERDEAVEDALRLGAFSGKDEAVAELERLKEQVEALHRKIVSLRERSDRQPLGVDISDYSDEWCAGYLAGQSNALDELDRWTRGTAYPARES